MKKHLKGEPLFQNALWRRGNPFSALCGPRPYPLASIVWPAAAGHTHRAKIFGTPDYTGRLCSILKEKGGSKSFRRKDGMR